MPGGRPRPGHGQSQQRGGGRASLCLLISECKGSARWWGRSEESEVNSIPPGLLSRQSGSPISCIIIICMCAEPRCRDAAAGPARAPAWVRSGGGYEAASLDVGRFSESRRGGRRRLETGALVFFPRRTKVFCVSGNVNLSNLY
ncbi:hypothetical protein NDU88_002560 [Pleurodeles waltl]|uniref:Uncharacterized protein n=1 Tax=Pleurodeles waltl TaxID=8319 RepID=A0AAV7T402_PLEWA|nr:hypothetical protein NDU88_002560 [Pleurodeles waltl]